MLRKRQRRTMKAAAREKDIRQARSRYRAGKESRETNREFRFVAKYWRFAAMVASRLRML
jgi:hypothetical protein